MLCTTLCYIERENHWLMLHRTRKKNDINHEKWLGVGGKFQDGESPEDCLLREVKEETGLTLTDYRFRAVITFVSDSAPTEYMHLFTATGFEGEIGPCDEGELRWVEKSLVPSLPLWEGDKVFFRLLEQNRPFFSLKLVYEGDRLRSAVLDGKEELLSAENR
ncbi:MAG: 8-oxo-dGTP diphosphatase [Clostridia bacterium]|nr:8-oxo-dGTP diphosphatase [Clostridia bacterium]